MTDLTLETVKEETVVVSAELSKKLEEVATAAKEQAATAEVVAAPVVTALKDAKEEVAKAEAVEAEVEAEVAAEVEAPSTKATLS